MWFLQAKQESITADAAELTYDREKWNDWSDDDPTIFLLIVIAATIPNGRTIKAIEGAAQKLKEHPPRWKQTRMVEVGVDGKYNSSQRGKSFIRNCYWESLVLHG